MLEKLKEFMKEDALLFDTLSKEICAPSITEDRCKELLINCEDFEQSVVLLNIVPSYYIMKTILYFKLNDFENAHKYINASLKYLVFVAKEGASLSQEEQKNFEAYKENVLDQYKILIQEKPEFANKKPTAYPQTTKFITSTNDDLVNEELNKRASQR